MTMTHNPHLENMQISTIREIEAVKPSGGYYWVGFWLSYADNVIDIVSAHLTTKTFNITKFYKWLDMNESTPIILKLSVLYSCMFTAKLYCCKAWGDLEVITVKLLKLERKALKRCLGVKSGTTDDILYCELNTPDIKERYYGILLL